MKRDEHGRADTVSPIPVLLENHHAFLRYLERRAGDRALAEDILQDVFVKIVARPDRAPADEAIVPWFYRTLRNAAIDQCRRRDAAGRAVEAFARELEAAVDVVGPFLLTALLRERLATCGGRVITLTGIYQRKGRVDTSDLHFARRPYSRLPANNRAQRGRLLFDRCHVTPDVSDPALDELFWAACEQPTSERWSGEQCPSSRSRRVAG